MKIPFVDLKAQYAAIAKDVDDAIKNVIANTDFVLGSDVKALEAEFASYCGAKYAVGLDNGMSALELALRALAVGPGDEVITTANTFIATAGSIAATGARPVLVDVDPVTYNMDARAMERAITARTKAVMPVHLYGQPADMDAILGIARDRRLPVIEDACQAHGARYKGRRCGSMGAAGCFSFYPGKMLVTNDQRIAETVSYLRNYGQREKYNHFMMAYNRRLDSIQAAVLRVKLGHLDRWNELRRGNAAAYGRCLAGTPVATPRTVGDVEHVFHVYAVKIQDRDRVLGELAKAGVAAGIHYPIPIHLQESFKHLGYPKGAFPVSEELAAHELSLPMYAELTAEQIEYVCGELKRLV